MTDDTIKTVGDLVAELQTHNPDKVVVFQIPGARAVGVARLDGYEDAIVIISEGSL